MTSLPDELIAPYLACGGYEERGAIVCTPAQAAAAVDAIIGPRVWRERVWSRGLHAAYVVDGASPRFPPSNVTLLKNIGWGTDRHGNLIGGAYELRKILKDIDRLFCCPEELQPLATE